MVSPEPIAVAVAVVEANDRYLVGVRPEGVPLAGLAEFPGGKVEDGESPKAAAVRECFEETGLMVKVTEKYFSKIHQYKHGLLEIHFFRCHLVTASSLNTCLPRLPFRWVTAEELATLEFPAANHQLTELLLPAAMIRNSPGAKNL
jgi:8-oxo-dGTP diphosphatase